MSEFYYKPCAEFDRCNELIEKYWESKQYDKCFAGHMELAEKGYPLAECQVGYFYLEGFGVEKDFPKAFYWTERAATHGDWDGQYTILALSMKTASALHRIWKKRNTGIKRRHSRDTIWLSKSAENTG